MFGPSSILHVSLIEIRSSVPALTSMALGEHHDESWNHGRRWTFAIAISRGIQRHGKCPVSSTEGALAENDEVGAPCEIGTLITVTHGKSDDIEVKRNCAYFLALLCEGMEFHVQLPEKVVLKSLLSLHLLKISSAKSTQRFLSLILPPIETKLTLQGRWPQTTRCHDVCPCRAQTLRWLGSAQVVDNFENHISIAEKVNSSIAALGACDQRTRSQTRKQWSRGPPCIKCCQTSTAGW